MQIYAINTENRFIHSHQALRGINYTCPECRQPVRLRGGQLRQLHFFHLQSTSCRLHQKSMTHLQIQLAITQLLGPETALIEHHFPPIGRIADVVWPSQKIIFEVQCSPISAQEVRARNQDYQKMGFQVVWILHKRRFNRTRVTGAERLLTSSPHYFTNINAFGKGFFYDQYALIRFKRRVRQTPSLPIQLNQVVSIDHKQLSRQVPEERKKWKLSFKGDLFHHPHLFKIHPYTPPLWRKILVNPYRVFLHHLLEKMSS